MKSSNYPIPPSHKTFHLDQIIIDSNFDSGNLYNAEKINKHVFNLWLAVDHPKNQYRTWFYFSIQGVQQQATAQFNIKNMQNQSRLLKEGLLPVYRQQGSQEWKKIAHPINLQKIEYHESWIEWSFNHTFITNKKVFFAFFYPWSNTDNDIFLRQIQQSCKIQKDIYFKRSVIIMTLEGRPVQFLTISSKTYIKTNQQQFQDDFLFPKGQEPKQFSQQKKCIIIGARVHPGEVPSSHVMTGIIKQLTQDNIKAKTLRDKFVFYIFPVINPDGVSRGHYRVDTNGINLNRCYINPSPKLHSPIYAIKKVIVHLHRRNRYFGFLDLHAHAARKGVFIYGNSINQLQKQVQICLFPKILSLNSQIFEYEGSNFTQRNMYVKQKNDHISKEGAGRVAIFKATKNPYSWTLQCNYNSSRIINQIDEPRDPHQIFKKPNQNELNKDIIINYKYPDVKQPKYFYDINHFRQLGKQICDSFLDLMQIHPQSRIDNSKSHFQSVQNLRMNLAIALLRMDPNRFQSYYRRIYNYIEGTSVNQDYIQRSLQALYYLLIKKVKIQNINSFLKDNDRSSLILPQKIKVQAKPKPKLEYKIRLKMQTHTNIQISKREETNKQENMFTNQQPLTQSEYNQQKDNEYQENQKPNQIEKLSSIQKILPNQKKFQTNKLMKSINDDHSSKISKKYDKLDIRHTIHNNNLAVKVYRVTNNRCGYYNGSNKTILDINFQKQQQYERIKGTKYKKDNICLL